LKIAKPRTKLKNVLMKKEMKLEEILRKKLKLTKNKRIKVPRMKFKKWRN
jgi:hypothetical protein